jgi:DNA-directed RNA polymerase specialized sigma24 family protein
MYIPEIINNNVQTEEALIKEEFTALWNKYKGLIYYIFKRHGIFFDCEADKQDCQQIICITVWKTYNRHRDNMRLRFRSYLYSTAKWTAFDYMKRLRTQNKHYRCMEYLDVLLPDEEYSEYMTDTLRQAVAYLSYEDQEIIKKILASDNLDEDSLKMGKSKKWLETRRTVITHRLKEIAPRFWPGLKVADPLDRSSTQNNNRSKQIDQLDQDGRFIKRWASLGDLERAGFSKHTISKIVNRTPNSVHAGFKWAFAPITEEAAAA